MTSRKRTAATFVAVAVAVLFAFAASAPAVTIMVNGNTPSVRFQAWADKSRMPTPAGVVSLRFAPCPDQQLVDG